MYLKSERSIEKFLKKIGLLNVGIKTLFIYRVFVTVLHTYNNNNILGNKIRRTN